jgi:hypothetical protein
LGVNRDFQTHSFFGNSPWTGKNRENTDENHQKTGKSSFKKTGNIHHETIKKPREKTMNSLRSGAASLRCAAGGCHVATSQDTAVHHGQAVSEDTGHVRGSCALVTFVGLSGWWMLVVTGT